MENTTNFEIDERIQRIVKNSRIKPEHCKFPVVGIPWQVITLPKCVLARQERGYLGINLQLAEIEASNDDSIRFRILGPMAFLVFILEGEIHVRNLYGSEVTRAKSGCFLLAYASNSDYFIHVSKGKHSFLAVALDKDWLIPAMENCPEFNLLLQAWNSSLQGEIILPHCPMSQRVNKLLGNIRLSITDSLEAGVKILMYILDCILIYKSLLTSFQFSRRTSKSEEAIKIRKYLYDNFPTKEKCTTKSISVALNISPWRIKELATTYFGMTIHNYVVKIRLETAKHLLRTTTKPVSTIGFEVGYSESTNFSRSFKFRYNIGPKAFKSLHHESSLKNSIITHTYQSAPDAKKHSKNKIINFKSMIIKSRN